MAADTARVRWRRAMALAIAPRDKDDAAAADDEIEYEMELEERMGSSHMASRFPLLRSGLGLGLLGLGLGRSASGGEPLLKGFLIHPDNRWYQLWTKFILLWAVYSSFFTPMEFAFFRGLPKKLFLLDIAGQFAFFIDIFVQFRVAYRDSQTYRIVQSPTDIAFRYVKSRFVFDLLGCFPWDYIHKVSGNKEIIRYLLWIRLTRACRVTDFFQKMEKDIRINYLFTRIVKLLVVELYCTHTAACIFYFLATTLPKSMEGYTWIGSLQLGDFSYSNFREIDLWRRYVTSLYFAIVTMATVGYGDVHAVNPREMVFIMIYVSFDMILGAYLLGNMTALIVKGSKTERYRDKMKDLIKYMNKNRLGKDMRDQIKRHVRLQYENIYNEALVLQDIPASIRAKIFQALYKPYIVKLPLFKGCSAEFKNQIVIRLQEESFLPGEVILEQGNTVDQLYFVLHGILDGIKLVENGLEEAILQLESDSSFGELAILCNIPQPYTVRVREFCTVLRIDKQLFTNILEIYFVDARKILNNLLEGNESNSHIKQLESDITFHIGKQEAEHALRVNNAAYGGDLNYLKGLISAGADPKKTDYDGRSPLHLAASRGHEDITLFLLQEGVDVNLSDKFGNTPLLEAVKQGHDRVASLLFSKGARLNIGEPGCHLCTAVARGDSDFIRRVLKYGIDPNSKDYDQRTPLHVAAAEGLYSIAKMLIEAGASVFAIDRWGATPLDEAVKSGSRSMMVLLENAKSDKLSMLPECAQEINDKTQPRRRCTVFPFHPWDPEEKRREGVVLWIPRTVEELIKSSNELLNCSGSRILSEDGGSISDAAMISDNQKLYLVADPNTTAMNNT
ncbi:Potassium channel [Musa troglodytarum]|uniref:Potassium channel n=2 Tax=Musa troglodytarum TaxID=320322 RepID=A0A9E7KU12_9LILI|nr:Potassium channel [Musa troglodytarum]URE31929.1 Potassium channel [Musa troglodytarum]